MPLAVAAKEKNALRIVAVDRLAEQRGLRTGLTLADAQGAVPELFVVEADEAADLAMLEKIADWCDRYTPLVALDPPDGLYLDISGCAHLFARHGAGDGHDEAAGDSGEAGDNGEAALLTDCLRRLQAQGFEARGAIASTAGAAWAVARYGTGDPDGIVPAGRQAAAVAQLPVAALNISPENAALLDRLGLKRIGQFYGKPRAPLAARCGTLLVDRLDQVLGHLDEVVVPRIPPPQFSAERCFAEPILHQEELLETVRRLAHALEPALDRHGLGARLVEASVFYTDGTVARVSVGTVAPLRAADAIAILFAERLSTLGSEWEEAGSGFDMVRLAVFAVSPLHAAQIDLTGEAEGDGSLSHLADRLGARLGASHITRFAPQNTHIPERAIRAGPLAVALATKAPAWAATPDAEIAYAEMPPDRPLRLFFRPEQAEVIAEVPAGPPRRFRWRRVTHNVVRAEGPERIAPEWWRLEDVGRETRDYYRVQDEVGRRYWIFREGLYGRETVSPIWYVHGLFA